MNPVAERLDVVRQRIVAAARRGGRDPAEVRLVAVSKTRPVDEISLAMEAGQREFGENRAQEFRDKIRLLGPEVIWHFLGRLQTNKVKYVVPGACLIHSLDRLDLAAELNLRAEKAGTEVAALVEVNTSGEATKGGVAPQRLAEFTTSLAAFPRVRVRGLMTMAAPGDQAAARESFRTLRELRDRLRAAPGGVDVSELSMGMSDDFEIAIEEGATIVRIGTAIFGPREYTATLN